MNKRILIGLSVVGLSLCGQAASYPADLVYYSKLDSAADITTPQVGPAGVDLGASFQGGLYGNALNAPAGSSNIVKLNLAGGLPADKGCIEFCAKILKQGSTYGVGYDPHFFTFFKSNNEVFGRFCIDANDGAGSHGFSLSCPYCFLTSFSGFDYSYDYSTIFGTKDPKAWHHYAIVWNTNGIAGASQMVQLYLDDQVVLSRNVAAVTPGEMESIAYLALGCGNSAVLIDEFRIWSTDRTTFPEGPLFPEQTTVSVSAVTAKQHYPWCGKIDIGYTVSGASDGLLVKITVKDNDNDVTYEAKTFDTTPTAAVGAHTVVWDATKDGVNKVSKNMVATVSLIVPEE